MSDFDIIQSDAHSRLILASRRKFLCASAAVIASLGVPIKSRASGFWSQPRELWLYRPASKASGLDRPEMIREVYWADGKLVDVGYLKLCRFLRDTHMNVAVHFDVVTLDIMRGVQGWLEGFSIEKPIIVHSAYRHPDTNANEGGVKNSFHTRAMAVDSHVQGVSTESIGRFGQYLSGGGVGFYLNKNFIHLDRGRVRSWVA
jgi:uncharacterized protein YcbK (DUF882 family)